MAVACAAVLFATTGQVKAGAITTLFAENNGGNLGGAVYFDIDVLSPAGISIEKIFTNTDETFASGNMNVYIRPGTFSGFTSSAAGWTLISSGLGNSAGNNNPSEFNVTDFILGLGVTGIALESQAGVWGHRYTNGTGTGIGGNQFYSNSDLSLTFGSASNVPFTGTTHNPRVWNGTIQYSVIPELAAVPEPSSLALFGIGASVAAFGAAGRRRREKKQEVPA